jgi:DNA-binding CsgD family transcriptional regulator
VIVWSWAGRRPNSTRRSTCSARRTPRRRCAGPLRDTGDRAGNAGVRGESGNLRAELTDAECRVAALAIAGRTNRQIADELFITVSTVEQHLTKIYRKLKVRRRADLSARLLPYDAPEQDGLRAEPGNG